MNRYILPAFGDQRVDAVSAKDVRNWFDYLSVTRAGSANRALAVLSSLMKHAETLGLRPEDSNPCRGLRRRKTGFEAHYLTDDKFAALGRALDGAEADHPVAVAALRFLLYAGARKSEALRLRWEHVHGDRAVLSDSKTGPRTIWLASPARAILAALPRRDDFPWVFACPDGAPVSLEKAWKAVRHVTGLGKLRIHDLRHAHAAVAVNGSEGLRVLAGLPGHADISTTFGYPHLAEGTEKACTSPGVCWDTAAPPPLTATSISTMLLLTRLRRGKRGRLCGNCALPRGDGTRWRKNRHVILDKYAAIYAGRGWQIFEVRS